MGNSIYEQLYQLLDIIKQMTKRKKITKMLVRFQIAFIIMLTSTVSYEIGSNSNYDKVYAILTIVLIGYNVVTIITGIDTLSDLSNDIAEGAHMMLMMYLQASREGYDLFEIKQELINLGIYIEKGSPDDEKIQQS